MCEFHGSNGNGLGDIWWTDNPIYFSSIDALNPVQIIIPENLSTVEAIMYSMC